ncbi:MAG TPA: hypothetical protein VEX63_05850 [Flavisolibacter sp.]|nr:hypothetical protein [Flavisolibacter sp.]
MIFKGERQLHIEEHSLEMHDITDFIETELVFKKADRIEVRGSIIYFENRAMTAKNAWPFRLMSWIDGGYIRIVPIPAGFAFQFQIEMVRLSFVALGAALLLLIVSGSISWALGCFLWVFGTNFFLKIASFYSFLEATINNLQAYINDPVEYQRRIAGQIVDQ